jgi:hypothetical protein
VNLRDEFLLTPGLAFLNPASADIAWIPNTTFGMNQIARELATAVPGARAILAGLDEPMAALGCRP